MKTLEEKFRKKAQVRKLVENVVERRKEITLCLEVSKIYLSSCRQSSPTIEALLKRSSVNLTVKNGFRQSQKTYLINGIDMITHTVS